MMREDRTEDDDLRKAIARAPGAMENLARRAGGCLTAEEVMAQLGISAEELASLRRRNRILAVPIAGEDRYPACQITGGRLIPALGEVLQSLAPIISAWERLDILLAPSLQDGQTLIDLLMAGRAEDAVRKARRIATPP